MQGAELFLVSGGAGGIGEAVCDALAAKGLTPVVGYRGSMEKAQAIAARTNGFALPLDMESESSVDAAAERLMAQSEPLAGVVLAGSPPLTLGPFGKITGADMQRQWQVNVAGPQRLLGQLVRGCFRKTKSGAVVGVLSRAMGEGGKGAASNMGAYVIAKYGMQGMLAVLAADYPWLRVRAVSPGYTETPMLSAFDARFLDAQREREPFQTPQAVAEHIVREAFGA